MSDIADAICAADIDTARAAALEAADGEVGEHLGVIAEGDRLVSHQFNALEPGYRGWFWSVSVSRAPDESQVTVNDVVLLPGENAVLAPQWTPYKDRLRPGDLGPGDVLPLEDDDIRLVPTWSAGDGDEQTPDRFFAREVGLGRERVLSIEGRQQAADRWMSGEYGPDTPIAEQASGACGSCGFVISLAGDLSDRFGVCGNGQANADGRVVAFTHGCGAHSGVKLKRSEAPQELPAHILDTVATDDVESGPERSLPAPEAAQQADVIPAAEDTPPQESALSVNDQILEPPARDEL